jgi:hypothetical protein
MLHIITRAYRYHLLNRVYDSIPRHNDITWHISKTSRRESLTNNFIQDNRVIIYEVDCDDSDITPKTNKILDNIKDGYFCFLDDDTYFYHNMYFCYQKFQKENFTSMIIGQQLFKNMTLKMKPSIPIKGSIDIANVLCHHSLIKDTRFQIENEENKGCKDYFFWKEIFTKNSNSALLIMSVLSVHNGLR